MSGKEGPQLSEQKSVQIPSIKCVQDIKDLNSKQLTILGKKMKVDLSRVEYRHEKLEWLIEIWLKNRKTIVLVVGANDVGRKTPDVIAEEIMCVCEQIHYNSPSSHRKLSSAIYHIKGIHKMGISVKDVNAHDFTRAFAAFLKKSGKMKVPEWTDFIKTGTFKELSPYDVDWYFIRAASICRHLYIRSPAGVGAFETIYGGRQRRGTAPSHFCKATGSISRRLLQSLENLKIVEKDPNGGRRLTSQGRRDLDRIAAQIKSKKSS